MRAAVDWDSVAGIVPVLLWLLFLVLKKRGMKRPREGEKTAAPKVPPPRQRRHRDETPKFHRDYDPIEPS